MTIFLQSLDYQLWHIVINGPRMPTRTIEGVVSPKPENEYNDNDFRMLQLNSKSKHVLFCAVGPNEFNRILFIMLDHEYELFLMHDNESISDMFTRFTTIINSLKNLGKSYSNQELVRKILRCLLKSWTPKVTAIEEAKDLSTLLLEQLLGFLMAHETTMKNHENVEVKKKKKTIALKASREESESEEDNDIILISKQFKKFLKSQKGKKALKKKFSQDEESNKVEEPTCYECKKTGHFKNECPNLKKKERFHKEQIKKKNEHSKKKKAMVATWDDRDP
ncbi:zf-CCHC domain-containing protein/UBN2 domain-containing protein [Cephalotus follicularis]|uniref:Zf-CCHC domain-containing protein/UBN2 domain-containing protein n=1 Tax=Cephalotus follicularis TaxID=3775 RepID=A0A1Q3AN98_CEPFO|nr:zf-CCHC domain-containing protein/UBN2 domain-containing protein [Cephalotus follicularis]